jgi:hypothetical protein
MERMRVSSPDTLVLEPLVNGFKNPLVSSKLNVLSYENGSYNRGSVTVSKYPDGTIVLDDGRNRVIQRPLNHPARQMAQSTCVVTKLLGKCRDFFRSLVAVS